MLSAIQHITVLIIFPVILWAVIILLMYCVLDERVITVSCECKNYCLQYFWDCWLSIRNSIWPVENWVRCRWFAYAPVDATALFQNSLPFWFWLTRLSWKKAISQVFLLWIDFLSSWRCLEFVNYLCMLYSQWITEMAKAGANQYTFHIEATNNVMDCIQRVKAANMKVRIVWHVICVFGDIHFN